MEKETIQHPSFGQISFKRISGRGQRFYGSELPQDYYIGLEVRTSEVYRDLSQDWYFPRNLILELRMTANQFSELISSMNCADIPCTLEYVKGEEIEALPKLENRKEFMHRKFESRMKEFADKLKSTENRAKELVKKKTLSKSDMQELLIAIDAMRTEITSNIPFFLECFQESVDKVVLEAKSEIENAIQHKINVLGLQELHNQNKLLSDDKR